MGKKAHKTYILCLQIVKMGVYFSVLKDEIEFVSGGWFRLKKAVFLFLVLVLLAGFAAAGAEEAGFRPGDWAFNHAPETSVLVLREDGTGVFQGVSCIWEDDGTFLHLTAETGEELSLRYLTSEERTVIYLPAEYVRVEGDAHEGVFGSWKGKTSEGSTFIFRQEDKRFLEDGTFTGTFRADPEEGTILLVYIGGFGDTLLYYSQEGNDSLTVEYPWPLVETQPAP